MSDTYTLSVKNFRSIHEASIDIAPLTVLYGPNGAGKSSLLYGLLTLRNFLTNPNQNVPSLFSYPTMSLGGFNDVVTDHDSDRSVSLSLYTSIPTGEACQTLEIGQSGGNSRIHVVVHENEGEEVLDYRLEGGLDIPFPYPGNQSETLPLEVLSEDGDVSESEFNLVWNGFGLSGGGDPSEQWRIADELKSGNSPGELARATGFVPLRRGFATPTFGIAHVTPALATDMEVASLLAVEPYLEYEVSRYVERVARRRVASKTQIGTSTFTIVSIPLDAGPPVSMVNEGFGVNQLAYMLTVCLYSKYKIVLIEEPEIHLHPAMVRSLAHTLADIASDHDKRLIVSTHSEAFVVALLSRIAAGEIGVDDVSFILVEKEDGESRFTKQEAKPNGQIEGGLDSFVASGFEDIAQFLGIDSEVASRN